MKELIISLISILLLCQGCVPLHLVEGSPDEKTLASIKADTTNKEDVLMMLGEPNRVMMKERFFQYWWTEARLFVGGWLGGFYGYMDSLHIYFDENNVVKKVELRKRFGEIIGEKHIKHLSVMLLVESYAGKYVEIGVPNISEIELNGKGRGIWREGGNEVSLEWGIGDDDIRLGTKSEVISVQIYDDIIEMPSPTGSSYRYFKRTK